MSLIKCKNCENDVSENDKFCPYCGVALTKTETVETEVVEVSKDVEETVEDVAHNVCDECGTIFQEGDSFCTKCGNPFDVKEIVEQTPTVVENTQPVVEAKKSKRKKPIIFGVLAVVVVVLISLFAVQKYKTRFDKHYLEMDAQISKAMQDVTKSTIDSVVEVVVNYAKTDDYIEAYERNLADNSYTIPYNEARFGMKTNNINIDSARKVLNSEINSKYSEEYQKYINDNLEYLNDLETINNALIDIAVNLDISTIDNVTNTIDKNIAFKVFNTRKDFINSFLADDEDAQAMLKEYEDSFELYFTSN